MQLAKGAEAAIEREGNSVKKTRVQKGYRIATIDERLRKQRTRSEASLLRMAKRVGILVPAIHDESKFEIIMEFVDGEKLRDVFEQDAATLSEQIATSVARMHANNIIHGDLTTSNMILKDGDIYFIDFGLGFNSNRAEDKAVDLYLLHASIESTHNKVLGKAWEIILNTYKKHYPSEEVTTALKKIEKRRRYTKKDN